MKIPMKHPALRTLPLVLLVAGCGAAVSRVDGDVPAVDAAVAPDAPVAVGDVPAARVDAGGRPDASAPVDVGAPPVDAGPGPACALGATEWDVAVRGKNAVFAFTSGGRWVISVDGVEGVSGVYAVVGANVELSGEMSGLACSPDDRGVYMLRFAPGCQRLRLALVRDDCEGRGNTIDTFELLRRR